MSKDVSTQNDVLFENPFHIEDIAVFDDEMLKWSCTQGSFGVTTEQLAHSLHEAPSFLVKRIMRNMPPQQCAIFMRELRRPASRDEDTHACKLALDSLFWELTYWKTPELYEELIEGEQLHPGIFEQLEPDVCGKTVLDVGAGSGRATQECLRYGAKHVYAVEPSAGLLRILERKLHKYSSRVTACTGRFHAIPLTENSVDTALSCSAFTALPEQGGEPGLAELWRVTKPGGKIILIWPRKEDREWLAAHGFHYVALPVQHEMYVRFRSLYSALHCAQRFYAHNEAVAHYVLAKQRPEVPFSVIGVDPPRDYYWLQVKKLMKGNNT